MEGTAHAHMHRRMHMQAMQAPPNALERIRSVTAEKASGATLHPTPSLGMASAGH
jgi:hypothetical protein